MTPSVATGTFVKLYSRICSGLVISSVNVTSYTDMRQEGIEDTEGAADGRKKSFEVGFEERDGELLGFMVGFDEGSVDG